MAQGRFALLLDGAFVTKCIGRRKRQGVEHPDRTTKATQDDVLAECARIRAHPSLSGLELLRIYWYDAKPATGSITNPISGLTTNLGQSETYKWGTGLLDGLEMQQDFALRLGELSTPPVWIVNRDALKQNKGKLTADDIKPKIEQKGVDLRIGLDIARLSLRQLVSVVVVVTGDSDMVPAFKFARREGVRVYLDSMGTPSIKRDVKAHVDLVIS